jgi:hypothetical protein
MFPSEIIHNAIGYQPAGDHGGWHAGTGMGAGSYKVKGLNPAYRRDNQRQWNLQLFPDTRDQSFPRNHTGPVEWWTQLDMVAQVDLLHKHLQRKSYIETAPISCVIRHERWAGVPGDSIKFEFLPGTASNPLTSEFECSVAAKPGTGVTAMDTAVL